MSNNKYNKAANAASALVFNAWKEGFEQGKLRVRVDTSYQYKDVCFDIDASIVFRKGIDRLNIDGGAGYDADLEDEDFIQVRFEVDPKLIPDYWEEISMNLKDLFRHEIEHLIHGEGWNSVPSRMMEDDAPIRKMINTRLLPRVEYFKLEKEVDANIAKMSILERRAAEKNRDQLIEAAFTRNLEAYRTGSIPATQDPSLELFENPGGPILTRPQK